MTSKDAKVVLVTGASAGIGRAVADHLHARGHRVYGASRSILSLEPKPAFSTIRMDLDDEASVREAVREIMEREGHIDALVNSAGYGLAGAVEDTSLEEARKQLETNFFGAVAVSREVLAPMRAQGAGTIVFVSSIAGMIPIPFQSFYSASKAAVSAYARALRMEVASAGIRVVAVEPGDHRTEFTERRRVAERAYEGVLAPAFQRAVGVMAADEQGGPPPGPVGVLVERILLASSPRASYLIGPWFQRFAVWLKYRLPARLFDWGLGKYYRLS